MRWIKRLIERRDLWLDTAIAAAFTVVAVLLGGEPEPGADWQAQDGLGIALTCLVNAPLALRRRAPLTVFAVSGSAWALFITLGYWPVVNSMGPFFALYTVASLRPLRPAVVCTVLVGAVWMYAGWRAGQATPAVLAQAAVFPAVGCRAGVAAQVSARRADRLAELAEQLRREQRDRMRHAVAEEQRRIARELHDVVAHHMSVINVQGGLASYVFDSEPETARAALRTINETSQEGLGELRRMLTLLRTGPEDGTDPEGLRPADAGATPYAPMPGLSRLGEMVERVRAAGVPVDLRTEGTPRSLAPGVELCAYRVVQEALTNVIKHARPADAVVVVAYGPRELTVTVTDDGRRERPLPANVPPSSGHGLIGMRERARLYGGTVDVGPRADGGFRVCLTLPTAVRTAGK
ncbi:sensor histidine kinase [Streptomyces toyocaensis]|uniref:sensor histidine kinase n=1 Tax=Streptomyces toyocaensis TaxID=55952 RepID=UPI000AB3CCA9|nr:sensor histidine kinase [Streptomyces toyocaensis]